MIPKKIHYCWFGGKPLNDMALKCIDSWKKFCPDYEIVEWNEGNFDVECCDYVREAYKKNKWAFVSDYARFKILYDEGGVYFDTDVELVKSINPIIEKGAFMASESIRCDVAPGLGIAAPKGLAIYKEILSDYEQSKFIIGQDDMDLTTVVKRITGILDKHGLIHKNTIQKIADITIYPKEYFCPLDYHTKVLKCTENTFAIHYYAGSWDDRPRSLKGKVYRFIYKVFGEKIAGYIKKYFNKNQ